MSYDQRLHSLYYLCDTCEHSKDRNISECWCANRVISKRMALAGDNPREICERYRAKVVAE